MKYAYFPIVAVSQSYAVAIVTINNDFLLRFYIHRVKVTQGVRFKFFAGKEDNLGMKGLVQAGHL